MSEYFLPLVPLIVYVLFLWALRRIGSWPHKNTREDEG